MYLVRHILRDVNFELLINQYEPRLLTRNFSSFETVYSLQWLNNTLKVLHR